jgi:hypothetical protein
VNYRYSTKRNCHGAALMAFVSVVRDRRSVNFDLQRGSNSNCELDLTRLQHPPPDSMCYPFGWGCISMPACIAHSARQPRLVYKHYDNVSPVPGKHRLIAPQQPSIPQSCREAGLGLYSQHPCTSSSSHLQPISELPPAACQVLAPLIAQKSKLYNTLLRQHSENIVLHSSRQSW